MRKRRALALVLALSMVVSPNTMTVFAAPENPAAQEQTQGEGQEDAALTEAQKKRQEADAAKKTAEEKKQELEKAQQTLADAQEKLKSLQGTPVDDEKAKAAYDKWQAAEKTVEEKQAAVATAETTLAEKKKVLEELQKTQAGSDPNVTAAQSGAGDDAEEAAQSGADKEAAPAESGAGDDAEAAVQSGAGTEAASAQSGAGDGAEGTDTAALQTLSETDTIEPVTSTDGDTGADTDSEEVKAAKQAVADAEAALQKAQDELTQAQTARDTAKTEYEALTSTGDPDAVAAAQKAVTDAETAVQTAQKAYDEAQKAYEAAEAEAVKAEEAERKADYDVSEAGSYLYEIDEKGVLQSIKKKGAGEGSADIPLEFKGRVELKQPEGDKTYTAVAASIFAGNTNLTYVKLPAEITTVTAGSFKGCTGLTGVYLPTTVTNIEDSAFENCTAMTQISLPKAVTSIGGSAFKNDTRLHLVHIKNGQDSDLTSIGASAFEGCTALEDFCSDEGFVLPDNLETIGEKAFYRCKSIAQVDMSETKVNTVGAHAFEGCTGIRDLVTGEKLAKIEEGAFAGCTKLSSISFVNRVRMQIGSRAFKGCIALKQLVLPQSVSVLEDGAFQDCTRLISVTIDDEYIDIKGNPFSNHADELIIIAKEGSNAYVFAQNNGIKTPDKDAFYRYTVEDEDGSYVKDGKFPGGRLWVELADATGDDKKDINTLNDNKGVKSGEKCCVWTTQSEEQADAYQFISSSLRCNGAPIKRDEKGRYVFEMPVGGAVITAEFRKKTPDKIEGQKVTVEFSAGEPIRDGEKDEIGYLGVALKVGQKTRMYVMDGETGKVVPSSQITYRSSNTKVATVSAGGVITASGTDNKSEADAVITATLVGGDGREITVNRTVVVTRTEARKIYLKASGYDKKLVKIEGDRDGIQTAAILKNMVSANPMTIKLEASVYDGTDSVGRDLTWTTSNSKVAVLAKAQTEAKDPTNVITVQKGCEGEAAITVTAKNSSDAEQEKITQKFVVRVYQKGYRLTASAVTVNPNSDESGYIEVIATANDDLKDVKKDSLTLYEKDSLGTSRFTAQYVEEDSKDNCKVFKIKPDASTINDGTYEVRVGINGEKGAKNLLPLQINVKHSMPKPTVRFNSKRTKFNLFYRNGGTDADGNPTVVTTEITKLGDDKIKKAALVPLTEKADDKLFTENFVIDETQSDYAAGRIVIRRTEGNLKYTSRKTPAVTGNLVLYFQGYGDSVSKKIKVTMPSCTTAPSYALRETKAVYRTGSGRQTELLEVYDKKTKNKAKVVLDENYSVKETAQEITRDNPTISDDGSIAVSFVPDKGKLRLALQNSGWDKDKNGEERTVTFNYSVSVSDKKPVFKCKTVTLNLNYPEVEETFALTANQKGLDMAGTQNFTPVMTGNNASEIAKLRVAYVDGKGVAGIQPGQTVQPGTYKFTCTPQVAGWPDVKAVTLSVKVVNTKPKVKLGKGSLKLNTVASRNNSLAITDIASTQVYREISEIPFQVNGAPVGYTLAEVGTDEQHTQMKGVGDSLGAEDKFSFYVRGAEPGKNLENVLGVSLKDDSVSTGTYTFEMTPRYLRMGRTAVSAAPVNVKVKVYSSADISVKVSAKGKINLVNREGVASDKNGVIYTPALQNLSGQITDVKIYDAVSLDEESKYFDIQMITEGKDKGKFYVTPKKTVKKTDTSVEYEYAQLEYNKNYPVRIWVQVDGYAGTADTKGGVLSQTLQLTASQTLPKVTTNKKVLDVYLISKNYDANFIVKPKEGSAGAIEDVVFGEQDQKARESFELVTQPLKDGSIKVIVHLKSGMEYPNESTSDVKMCVKYRGQGDKTPESASSFNMKIKIN